MPRKFSDLTTINMNNEYTDDTYVVGYYKNSNSQNDNSKINVKQFSRTSDLEATNIRVSNLENSSLLKDKSEDQTVIGEIIFNGNIATNGVITINDIIKNQYDNLTFKSNTLDISNTADNTMNLYWKDKNGVNSGIDTLGTSIYGDVYRNMRVKAHNSDNYAALGVVCDANDDFFAYAPTPSSLSDISTKIVTTEWINDKFQVVTSLPDDPISNVFYFVKE